MFNKDFHEKTNILTYALLRLQEETEGMNDYGDVTGFCEEQECIMNNAFAQAGQLTERAYRLRRRIEKYKRLEEEKKKHAPTAKPPATINTNQEGNQGAMNDIKILFNPSVGSVYNMKAGEKFAIHGEPWVVIQEQFVAARRVFVGCRPDNMASDCPDTWSISRRDHDGQIVVAYFSTDDNGRGVTVTMEDDFAAAVDKCTKANLHKVLPLLRADPVAFMKTLLTYCKSEGLLASVPSNIDDITRAIEDASEGFIILDKWTEGSVRTAIHDDEAEEKDKLPTVVIRRAMAELNIDSDYGVSNDSFHSLIGDAKEWYAWLKDMEQKNGICPDCGRPKAATANDILENCCPKWWEQRHAVRNDPADTDCANWRSDTMRGRKDARG